MVLYLFLVRHMNCCSLSDIGISGDTPDPSDHSSYIINIGTDFLVTDIIVAS